MKIDKLHKVYFLGIGGIGMSALARYFNSCGKAIYGYDKTETALTKKLVEEGMQIHYDDDIGAIPHDPDLVVYTPAIPDSLAELSYIRQKGFPLKKRAEVLGLISQAHQAIAVAGTHGKTTTSTILAHLLRSGGIDCTAFLGGIANNFGSNFVAGHSGWMVAEADEYDRSFLQLQPDIALILSMDADHLDIYGSADQMAAGFCQFAEGIKADGRLIYRFSLAGQLAGQISRLREAWSYGLEAGDFCARDIRVENGMFVFDLQSPFENLKALQFTLPGFHNVENAVAAIAVAQLLDLSEAAIRAALLNFKGIRRRFERVFANEQLVYIDDYAHHPTELEAAIYAARTLFPKRKITGIFQPHLYSRTRDFADGFAAALDRLDRCLLMDIYPAREEPIPGVEAGMILERMHLPDRQLVKKATLLDTLKTLDLEVLLTLGAGDIDTFVQPVKSLLANE